MEEVTTDMVDISRKIELEAKPEDVVKLLQSNEKTTNEEWLLKNEQRKGFLEMKSIRHDDVVKIMKITTKNLEYYINLVNKAAAELETKTDPNSERSSAVGKMQSNSISYYREIVHERENQLI